MSLQTGRLLSREESKGTSTWWVIVKIKVQVQHNTKFDGCER